MPPDPPPPPETPPVPILAVFDGISALRITFDKPLRNDVSPPVWLDDVMVVIADIQYAVDDAEIEGFDVLKLTVSATESVLSGSFVSYAAANPPRLEGINGLLVEAFSGFPIT